MDVPGKPTGLVNKRVEVSPRVSKSVLIDYDDGSVTSTDTKRTAHWSKKTNLSINDDVLLVEKWIDENLKQCFEKYEGITLSRNQLSVLDESFHRLLELTKGRSVVLCSLLDKIWKATQQIYECYFTILNDNIDSMQTQLMRCSQANFDLHSRTIATHSAEHSRARNHTNNITDGSVNQALYDEKYLKLEAEVRKMTHMLSYLTSWFPNFSKYAFSVLNRYLPPHEEREEDKPQIPQAYLMDDVRRIEQIGIRMSQDPSQSSSARAPSSSPMNQNNNASAGGSGTPFARRGRVLLGLPTDAAKASENTVRNFTLPPGIDGQLPESSTDEQKSGADVFRENIGLTIKLTQANDKIAKLLKDIQALEKDLDIEKITTKTIAVQKNKEIAQWKQKFERLTMETKSDMNYLWELSELVTHHYNEWIPCKFRSLEPLLCGSLRTATNISTDDNDSWDPSEYLTPTSLRKLLIKFLDHLTSSVFTEDGGVLVSQAYNCSFSDLWSSFLSTGQHSTSVATVFKSVLHWQRLHLDENSQTDADVKMALMIWKLIVDASKEANRRGDSTADTKGVEQLIESLNCRDTIRISVLMDSLVNFYRVLKLKIHRGKSISSDQLPRLIRRMFRFVPTTIDIIDDQIQKLKRNTLRKNGVMVSAEDEAEEFSKDLESTLTVPRTKAMIALQHPWWTYLDDQRLQDLHQAIINPISKATQQGVIHEPEPSSVEVLPWRILYCSWEIVRKVHATLFQVTSQVFHFLKVLVKDDINNDTFFELAYFMLAFGIQHLPYSKVQHLYHPRLQAEVRSVIVQLRATLSIGETSMVPENEDPDDGSSIHNTNNSNKESNEGVNNHGRTTLRNKKYDTREVNDLEARLFSQTILRSKTAIPSHGYLMEIWDMFKERENETEEFRELMKSIDHVGAISIDPQQQKKHDALFIIINEGRNSYNELRTLVRSRDANANFAYLFPKTVSATESFVDSFIQKGTQSVLDTLSGTLGSNNRKTISPLPVFSKTAENILHSTVTSGYYYANAKDNLSENDSIHVHMSEHQGQSSLPHIQNTTSAGWFKRSVMLSQRLMDHKNAAAEANDENTSNNIIEIANTPRVDHTGTNPMKSKENKTKYLASTLEKLLCLGELYFDQSMHHTTSTLHDPHEMAMAAIAIKGFLWLLGPETLNEKDQLFVMETMVEYNNEYACAKRSIQHHKKISLQKHFVAWSELCK